MSILKTTAVHKISIDQLRSLIAADFGVSAERVSIKPLITQETRSQVDGPEPVFKGIEVSVKPEPN